MVDSKARIFRNVLYAGLAKGTTLLCMAVTSLVLARNLSPSDYGVVGFAGIIIGFFSNFSDLGVSTAAVRRPSLDWKSLQTALTLKIVLGVLAFLAVYLVAPFAHHFFEHPATGDVMRALALNFLVSTIGFMPTVILTREENFRALIIPGILSVVARSIIAIVLVLSGWTYWSVVLADIGATVVSSVAIQFVRKIPLRLQFEWREAREFLQFGGPLVASGVLVFIIFNLDNLLIGASMGSVQLGYYALAFTWGSYICGILYDTVNKVLFPAFSAIQQDVVAMRRWYLKTIDLMAFLSLVVNATLLVNAQAFLVTVLGGGSDKWVPATVALQVLCGYGIIRAITEPLGNCILALGSSRTLLQATLVAGVIEIMSLLLVLGTGRIELVASVVLLAYVSQALIYLPFLRRHLNVGLRDLAMQLWPVLPAIMLGYGTTVLVPESSGSSLMELAMRGLFTAVVVASVHGLCTRFRCFHEATGMIVGSFARVRA